MSSRDYDSREWKVVSRGDLEPYGILLVEDDAIVSKAFSRLLESAGYRVWVAQTVEHARALATQPHDYHAAIVDFSLPDGYVTDFVAELLTRRPLCRSVVVTGAGPTAAQETARAGAHAYLPKPSSAATLLAAVSQTVESTLAWRRAPQMPDTPGRVPFDIASAVARLRDLGKLSPAETLTAWRLLWGDSNKRISVLLGCTERTVKFHVAEVLARTGARSRAGLLRVLLEDGGTRDPWDARGDRASSS